MPVTVQSGITGPFTPNGATLAFAFTFKADSASEVIVVDEDGTPLSTALYSVALNTGEGGTVTFSVAPLLADHASLYIVSDPEMTQESDFGNAGPSFNPAAITRAFDRAAIRDLALQAELDRALKVPFGSTSATMPADRAGKFLAFDGSGVPIASSGTGADAGMRADLAASGGSSLVGYLQSGTGATSRTVQAKLRDTVSVKDYGAVGDASGATGSGTDNAAAFQAALDYLGTQGGGTLVIPASPNGYRITTGLKLPANVAIEGSWGEGYPYTVAGSLVADFSNPNQWAIEPKTTVGGNPVAYNAMVTGSLPGGATYDCGVRNLTLRAATGATTPYGGIRFHGCPGSFTEGVSVVGFGNGLLVNYSFGGRYHIHVESLYTGVAAWDDANANVFHVYVAQSSPNPATIPAGYLLPFMASLSSTLTSTYHLTTNAHYNRPQGVICGSSASQSVNNVFDATVERYGGGLFLLNALATDFRQCYLEGSTSQMLTAIVAAQSTFSTQSLHAFLSGTGDLFDIGDGGMGDVRANGSLNVASFGSVYLNSSARLVLRSLTIDQLSAAPPQFNILYETAGPMIAPTLVNSWANVVGDVASGYRREGGRVYLDGAVNSGSSSTTITTLPAGYRPFAQVRDPAGKFRISSAGVITADTTGPISFTGFSFVATG